MFNKVEKSFVQKFLAVSLMMTAMLQQPVNANPTGLVTRIDHILIEHQKAGETFEWLNKVFQLPVVWPFASYGAFSSGGVYFGNVAIELGQFGSLAATAPQAARFAGVAFEPQQATEASITTLDELHFSHGNPEPFMSYKDGQQFKLWTNVSINGVAPADSRLFLCQYHVNTQPRLLAAQSELAKQQGGPLGLIGVKNIVVESSRPDVAKTNWQRLLAPVTEDGKGALVLSNGPGIMVRPGNQDALSALTLEVRSLEHARKFLNGQGIPFDDGKEQITLGGPF